MFFKDFGKCFAESFKFFLGFFFFLTCFDGAQTARRGKRGGGGRALERMYGGWGCTVNPAPLPPPVYPFIKQSF